MVELT